ncbi:polysaccharide biosynthesis tyrosine autokinase [Allopusillimonas ginsengisoli]|uniref:polysaccharide biosynthesis tyrosine autokinase n=1 Tax=Allopusillimonas ginsengisoli TaxID=453575 RepID=UPI00101EEA35|nr:polysaccharide biosynthesis tyrosine autokinase [Allopusillimonas ginsengisoli]TEA79946.1 polysaccharide biosynthesis tyrosine autokinase [Allopusillimonas ginsengisoli]
MNSEINTISPLVSIQDEHTINFFRIIDIILEQKWLISGIGLLVLCIAASYAFISQPIYQANMLIQVETNSNNTASSLGEMAVLFDVQSPASAEMEILRSRYVIGKAADDLALYTYARPDYLPIIGEWLAKRATSLSDPGFLWFDGYVTGTESIAVEQLDVSEALKGKELLLVVTDDGYRLSGPDSTPIANGKVGIINTFNFEDGNGKLLIKNINAKPGARFLLKSFSRLKTITDLQTQLNIGEKGKQSGIIAVTLKGPDPSRTSEILNSIGQAYVQQNIERKAAEAEKTLSFLDDFLPQLRQQMSISEEKYTEFRDAHGTFNLGSEGELSLQASANLQTKLLELEQKRRELMPRFQPNHPAIRTIDNQIVAIQDELQKIEKNVKKMPDIEQQLLSLMRNVKVNSEMYVNLLNSAQQLRLVKEGKVGNVRVIDTAAKPEVPVKPNRLLIIALGAFFGLLAGVCTAIVRAWLNPGVKDPAEIESALGMHVFATVPHSSSQAKFHQLAKMKEPGNHVLATKEPQDPAIESLRSLRTALQFALLEAKNNLILLSGPTPGIGKSFTSMNFAAVLGAGGKRVMLVDADMRKGYLNQYVGLPRQHGLSELISGTITLEQATHKNVIANVDVITTGVLPPNPTELLLSSTTKTLLEKLSDLYDYVLIDTSPILPVADALVLTPFAGTIFLLARANVSTIGELEESIKRIKQTGKQVKGIIFNDLVPTTLRYGSRNGGYKYMNYNYKSES